MHRRRSLILFLWMNLVVVSITVYPSVWINLMLSVHRVLFFSSFLFSLYSVWIAISRKKSKIKNTITNLIFCWCFCWSVKGSVLSVLIAFECMPQSSMWEKKIQVKYVQSAMRKYYVPVCPATDLKASSQCNHAVTSYLFTMFSAIQFWYEYFSLSPFFRFFCHVYT